ncbi:MAG: tetratricopeptide repeat protein [Edaphobacter sp.]
MDRIALLTQVLQQNPADAFARYGLAMAYAAEDDTDKALEEFNLLIQHNPDYVPGYQMSAQTLAKLNRNEEAIARLKEGIATASRTGNDHAADEMQAHLDDLTR